MTMTPISVLIENLSEGRRKWLTHQLCPRCEHELTSIDYMCGGAYKDCTEERRLFMVQSVLDNHKRRSSPTDLTGNNPTA